MLLLNCVAQVGIVDAEGIWSWDGASWRLVDHEGPEPLEVTGIAYDSARGVVVRYGGLPMDSNTCAPETWEWDHDTWRQVEVPPPTACDHMKLAYDADAGVTLLFGGQEADRTPRTETWAWDGQAWERVADGGPRSIAHFGFAYDDVHGQTFLYGGLNGVINDDFWSWDGSGWQELDFGGPGIRSHPGMAASAHGLLLFGGATTSATFESLVDETWFLTNGTWSLIQGDAPSPRGSPALGYDIERDVFVLFGGFGPDGGVLGDTWEWDGTWRCVDGC
jgi:hypothetical protein